MVELLDTLLLNIGSQQCGKDVAQLMRLSTKSTLKLDERREGMTYAFCTCRAPLPVPRREVVSHELRTLRP